MKLIIAGSRDFINYQYLTEQINTICETRQITEIVSGGAKGADKLGEKYAQDNNIPFKVFKAKWNVLNTDTRFNKKNTYGKLYNVKAGFDRNEEMAVYADALAVFFKEGASNNGSNDMLTRANNHNLITYQFTK